MKEQYERTEFISQLFHKQCVQSIRIQSILRESRRPAQRQNLIKKENKCWKKSGQIS